MATAVDDKKKPTKKTNQQTEEIWSDRPLEHEHTNRRHCKQPLCKEIGPTIWNSLTVMIEMANVWNQTFSTLFRTRTDTHDSLVCHDTIEFPLLAESKRSIEMNCARLIQFDLESGKEHPCTAVLAWRKCLRLKDMEITWTYDFAVVERTHSYVNGARWMENGKNLLIYGCRGCCHSRLMCAE